MFSQTTRIVGACLAVALLLISSAQAQWDKIRIVNGEIIDIADVPYIVQLRGLSNKHFCGGTLVTPQHVVTAAHCFDEVRSADVTVVGGANHRDDAGVRRRVASVVKHESYDATTYEMDIAVIKLDQPMMGDHIHPVRLCKAALTAGDSLQVSGWGSTGKYTFVSDKLHTVRLGVVSLDDCSDMLEDDPYGLGDSVLCAYTAVEDSCSGDSGGPAINRGELCGVISWGHGCAERDAPGVFTSIDIVRDFIEKALKN